MRLVQNCLIGFWTLHFAAAGLLRSDATVRPWTESFAIAGFAGFVEEMMLHLPLALGFAEFAVAGLFALALMIRLVGVEEEQQDAVRYAQWAAAFAILLLSVTHVLNHAAGGDGAAILADLAKATFLALTAFCFQALEPARQGARDEGDEAANAGFPPAGRSPYLRAQEAALAVDARHMLKGPSR